MANITTVELDIEVPEKNLLSLKEGMLEDDWVKIKKKQQLEEEYKMKLKELEMSEEMAMLQAAANLEKVYQTQLEQFTDREKKKKILPEDLSSIVCNLAEAHSESAQVIISKGLLKQEIELTFRLDQLDYLSMQRKIDPSMSDCTVVRTKTPS